jgi:N-acetylglucosaminyl-diphospho-decaprenol L-rhamnosyltransferase
MDVSLIILNYKTKDLLQQCLEEIVSSHWALHTEVVVVDNDSRDGSLEMIRERFPTVRAIASGTNVGFAAGMNLAFKEARGRYFLILNPDVSRFGNAVPTLCAYMERHPKVGLAAPRLVYPDGREQISCYRFPTVWIPLLRRTPLGHLPWAQEVLGQYVMRDFSRKDNLPVGWVIGACMLIRRSALEEVGAFDERFFLYFEDVDLCRRLWQAGWEVHYVADAEVVHRHQRLSAEDPGIRGMLSHPTRAHIESAVKYFAKYLGAPVPPHSL